MKTIGVLALVYGVALVSGCGGGGGSDNYANTDTYRCSLACLKAAPNLSTATVSSATGGTVTVTFEVDGDYTGLQTLHVVLDHVSAHSDAGGEFVALPLTGATVSVDITVPAGTAEGFYYPNVFFQTALDTYGQYVLASDFSATKYLYAETVGTTETHVLSPFNVPRVEVTP